MTVESTDLRFASRLASVGVSAYTDSIITPTGRCVICGANVPGENQAPVGFQTDAYRYTQQRNVFTTVLTDWREKHVEFHNRFITREEAALYMSDVKWCDNGNHAFPADEPGAQRYTVEEIVNNKDDIPVRVTRQKDSCATHSVIPSLSRPAASSALMVESAATRAHTYVNVADVTDEPVGTAFIGADEERYTLIKNRAGAFRFVNTFGESASVKSILDQGPLTRA